MSEMPRSGSRMNEKPKIGIINSSVVREAFHDIKNYYEGKKSERSNVPYMNHILEGLFILERIGASDIAKAAFCLHPIFQESKSLKQHYDSCLVTYNPYVIVLAMEYRGIANSYLSGLYSSPEDEFDLSPLEEVNQMLIADKVQNRKDFERYHSESHPRKEELKNYFKNWLNKLGVSEEEYQEHVKAIDKEVEELKIERSQKFNV